MRPRDRADLVDRVDRVDRADLVDLVTFGHAGLRLAIESVFVKGMGPASASLPPLFDKVGVEVPGRSVPARPFALSLAIPLSGNRAVSVEGPVELQSLDKRAIHPLPAALALRCAMPWLRAIAYDAGGFMLVLDPRRESWTNPGIGSTLTARVAGDEPPRAGGRIGAVPNEIRGGSNGAT
ncbi:MAG TPA: hypothetical protein VMV44_07060 [Rectinemataceae bacterium]|nr:hypothetical protein [Rectinemataceae bacterium]